MFEPQKWIEMMQKAFEVEQKMKEILKGKVVQGVAGGGLVELQMNANFEVLSLKIDASLLKPEESQFVADMVKAALNDALGNVKGLLAEQVKSIGLR